MVTVTTGNSLLSPARIGFNKAIENAEDSAARLVGGKRTLRSGDDVSTFSIASKLQTQIYKYRQSVQDVATSDTLVSAAKAGLEAVRDRLERAAELAEQANSDTLIAQERANLQAQFDDALAEIDRIASDTTFDDQALLQGDFADRDIRLGPEENDFVNIAISDVSSEGLFGPTPPDLSSQGNAAAAESSVADALETVGNIIGSLTGAQGQLFSANANISSTLSGVSQAKSELTDVNTEEELLSLAKSQLRIDLGSSVIAQASRLSDDLLNVLEFKIDFEAQDTLNEEEETTEEKPKETTDNESSNSVDTNASSTPAAA